MDKLDETKLHCYHAFMKRVFRHYVTCRFGQQCADVQTSPLVGLKAPIPVFFFYSFILLLMMDVKMLVFHELRFGCTLKNPWWLKFSEPSTAEFLMIIWWFWDVELQQLLLSHPSGSEACSLTGCIT